MSYFQSLRESLIKGECNLVTKDEWGETLLLSTLRCEELPLDVLKLMLDQGADVNSVDEYGDSCLHAAFSDDYPDKEINEDVIRELLERGAEVNKLGVFERTPLLVLLQRDNCPVSIVKLLLNYGAEVNCMDVYRDTVLIAAIRNSEDEAVIQVLVEAGANVGKDSNNPLKELLRSRKNCSSNLVKLFLQRGADVNHYEEEVGYFPLMQAIENHNEAVFQVLIEGGAVVNYVSNDGESPLMMLLQQSNCTVSAVKLLIQALLEEGASIDMLNGADKSFLCHAFRHSSNDVVKMMLDAGCSPRACKYHASALHCAVDNTKSGLREDILECLLKEKFDLNYIDNNGRSLLCYALNTGAKALDIKLLMRKGASLTSCRMHSLPLICATNGPLHTLLRTDVVKLLLDKGAEVGDSAWVILEGALRRCNYQVGAIQLLLDLPGVVDCLVCGKSDKESILHIAVSNHHCKLGAVELLINRMSEMCREIKSKDTLLHCAVINKNCKASIINLLLKKGFPFNTENTSGDTPLVVLVKKVVGSFQCVYDSNVMKELLIAGAQIGVANCCNGKTLMESILEKYNNDRNRETLEWFKILVKFFYLQNPQFGISDCQRVSRIDTRGFYHWNNKEFEKFVNQCLYEVHEMESLHIVDGNITLGDFVRGYCLPNKLSPVCNLEEKNYNLNQLLKSTTQNDSTSKVPPVVTNLLKHLAQITFIMYFKVVLARFDRSVLLSCLPGLKIFALTDNSSLEKINLNPENSTEKINENVKVFAKKDNFSLQKINLNLDVVKKIASLLSDKDLLALILASFDSKEKPPRKRSPEPSTEQHKFPKYLHRRIILD